MSENRTTSKLREHLEVRVSNNEMLPGDESSDVTRIDFLIMKYPTVEREKEKKVEGRKREKVGEGER